MTNVEALDLNKSIGKVTLSDGETKLYVPKLTMLKLISLVKFFGIDGSKLYGEFREILLNEEISDIEKIGVVLEGLNEEQLIHVFSILLEIEDEDALQLDINEMLDILLVYSEKIDINRTFLQIRELTKKVLGKELPPTLNQWMEQKKQVKAGATS
jgi:hypothetical protein